MAGTAQNAQISWKTLFRGSFDPHTAWIAFVYTTNLYLVKRRKKYFLEKYVKFLKF